jgi:hypothetical protein
MLQMRLVMFEVCWEYWDMELRHGIETWMAAASSSLKPLFCSILTAFWDWNHGRECG